MQLLEGLKRFLQVAKLLVHQTKVVDCLHTISFDTNGLKIQLFRLVLLTVDIQAVA